MKKNILIQPITTIKEAMENFGKTAEKVLLVVDQNQTLLGTLSEGDVRRSILNGKNLNESVESVFNKHPIVVKQGEYDSDLIRELLANNRIGLIPVVNQTKKIMDYITWEDVFKNIKKRKRLHEKINTFVVIMAGGKGTRLDPFTRVLPKALIPIENRPIIELIIDKFREYGINQYYLTLNHMSKIIRAYFEERNLANIFFIEEDKPLGTAGSLKLLKNKIKSPFFITNCDIIVNADYGDIYDFHVKNKFDITLAASMKDYQIPYGICEIENGGKLINIKEKPKYSFFINTGFYIVNHDVVKLIPKNKFFDMTDLIHSVKENGGLVGVFPISESSWVDVGNWAEYNKAHKILEGIG